MLRSGFGTPFPFLDGAPHGKFMAQLSLALPTIFLHEGVGYVYHSSDPGGPTSYGVSLRFLKSTGDLDKNGWLDGDIDNDGDIDIDDIRKMKEQDAARLYDLYFWSKYGYAMIKDQSIATKVFDLSINMGSVGAHKCIQRAVRSASCLPLADDGILGPKTFISINSSVSYPLLAALKSEAAGYYRSIKYNGSKDFLKGWLNRAYSDSVLSLQK